MFPTPSCIGYVESPIGLVQIVTSDAALLALDFVDPGQRRDGASESAFLAKAVSQIAAYFEGRRRVFDLPVSLAGTPFQRQVWQQLAAIPYGETTSYQAIAASIGRPKAMRAVGAANGLNPISIVLPCHRVIGKNGRLVGYGGGLWRKEWLLKHEGAL